MLDLSKATDSFEKIKKALAEKGVELNVQIKIQHEDIFNSMHSL
jgi:ACT domain-containing protein